MCYWILTVSGKVIVNTTVQHEDPNINKQIEAFNTALTNQLDDTKFQTPKTANILYLEDEPEDVASEETKIILKPTDQEYSDLMGSVDAIVDNKCPEVVDRYIGAQLKLKLAGEEMQGTVIGSLDGQQDRKSTF
jgi:hypothetical protein